MDAFRVHFDSALLDVIDASPEEARRVLLEKLPEHMRKWVVEAEVKKAKENQIVEMCMPGDFMLEDVEVSLEAWLGERALSVSPHGDDWYTVRLPSEEKAQKLMEFNGHIIGEEGTKLSVRMVERYFSTKEMFAEITHQMEIQEKVAETQKKIHAQIRKVASENPPVPGSPTDGGGVLSLHVWHGCGGAGAPSGASSGGGRGHGLPAAGGLHGRNGRGLRALCCPQWVWQF
jgi:hypothetical protein